MEVTRRDLLTIVATAAKMLVAIYAVLRDKVVYADLGAVHLDNIDRERATRRLVGRLSALGYSVDLQPSA